MQDLENVKQRKGVQHEEKAGADEPCNRDFMPDEKAACYFSDSVGNLTGWECGAGNNIFQVKQIREWAAA